MTQQLRPLAASSLRSSRQIIRRSSASAEREKCPTPPKSNTATKRRAKLLGAAKTHEGRHPSGASPGAPNPGRRHHPILLIAAAPVLPSHSPQQRLRALSDRLLVERRGAPAESRGEGGCATEHSEGAHSFCQFHSLTEVRYAQCCFQFDFTAARICGEMRLKGRPHPGWWWS